MALGVGYGGSISSESTDFYYSFNYESGTGATRNSVFTILGGVTGAWQDHILSRFADNPRDHVVIFGAQLNYTTSSITSVSADFIYYKSGATSTTIYTLSLQSCPTSQLPFKNLLDVDVSGGSTYYLRRVSYIKPQYAYKAIIPTSVWSDINITRDCTIRFIVTLNKNDDQVLRSGVALFD